MAVPAETAVDPTALVYAIVGAAGYAAQGYLRKQPRGVPFDREKFAATLLVAALIGALAAIAGNPLDAATVETQLLAYAGLVAIVEGLLKSAYREYETTKKQPPVERSG